MRFSAPASPGNSGGPLLDKDGRAIGIVLMKSPNENLNYALPIDEVLKAPDNLAVIDKRLPYQPTFSDTPIVGDFRQQFALPKSFADFSATFLKLKDAFADDELKKLRSQLYGKAGQFMDMLLSAWSFTRDFGSEKIRLTSLGKPIQDSTYTDTYQRHWQIHVWPLAFANQYVMSFLLPVPDGYAGVIGW